MQDMRCGIEDKEMGGRGMGSQSRMERINRIPLADEKVSRRGNRYLRYGYANANWD
jgi:hypothetical protein